MMSYVQGNIGYRIISAYPATYFVTYSNAYPATYPNSFPVISPTEYPVYNRQDPYQPPPGLQTFWWGWQLSLDENQTQSLTKILTGGAATPAAIMAFLSGAGIISAAAATAAAPVAPIIAGIIGLEIAGILATDVLGGNKGVVIEGTWAGGITMRPRK
ncbi:hypothetical protein COJ42_13730 [Bacillus cereus]|nr:hypothetical protein CN464_07325 [Bacillus cereus]PFM33858.1 hypothetical protein COJ42_13730 [Bacillus cereus]PFP92816.1 hypothetical protein COK02_12450 [Bacillus cereus]